MKTIIEVGANNGNDTAGLLKKWEDSIIYAFEPTHELLEKYLWKKFENNGRVKILPFAIDIENTFKQFHIAGQGDWGCSSLYEFSPDIHNKWKNRPDFKETHSYIIPTIRLDDFCKLYNIKTIDYLHIDAQGNDFNCLLSLGDMIDNVKEGQCEVAYNTELYSKTNNTYETVKTWLESKGFFVKNSPFNHEIDLYFVKKNR